MLTISLFSFLYHSIFHLSFPMYFTIFAFKPPHYQIAALSASQGQGASIRVNTVFTFLRRKLVLKQPG